MKSFESKHLDDSSLLTYVDHETPQICEEEPTIPFVPFPPSFSVPIWVPPCDDVEVGKYESKIVDPSFPPSSTSHDFDPIEENLEWFNNYMELEVKVDPLVFKYHVNMHNPNLNLI